MVSRKKFAALISGSDTAIAITRPVPFPSKSQFETESLATSSTRAAMPASTLVKAIAVKITLRRFPSLVVGVVVEAALRRGGESRIHEGDPDRRDHRRELQQPELLGREEASVDRQRDHADRLNRDAAQAVDERLLGDADDVAGLFGLSRVGSPAFEIGSHGYSVVR